MTKFPDGFTHQMMGSVKLKYPSKPFCANFSRHKICQNLKYALYVRDSLVLYSVKTFTIKTVMKESFTANYRFGFVSLVQLKEAYFHCAMVNWRTLP